jgi:hypothetical protein
MVELSRMGRDPLTGKLMETPAEKALETEAAKSRIAYYNALVEKAQKEDPDAFEKASSVADRIINPETNRPLEGEARTTFILGQLGGAEPGEIFGPGINAIPTINSQAEYDALPSGSQYYDSSGKLATKK